MFINSVRQPVKILIQKKLHQKKHLDIWLLNAQQQCYQNS